MKRILAIQVKQIGDVLLTLPALRVLRRVYPEAHITFAVSGPAAGLAECFACVDEVIGVGSRWFEPRMWSQIGGPCYDLALDFSGTDRALFLSVLCGAHTRSGYRKHAEEGFFRRRVYTEQSPIRLRDHHTIDYFIHLLETIGIEPGPEPLSVTLPQETLAEGRERLARELGKLDRDPATARTAVVHAGTARSEKYWVAERWAEVLRALDERGFTPVLTGASGEEERRHVAAIKAGARDVPVIDLVGDLSLLQSTAVIAACDLFLGVDTAAMHLASALQRPTVALFGPTSPFRWRPRHAEARIVVSGQDCLATRFKADDEAGDMQAISTQTVIGAMDSLLGTPRT